MCTSVTSGELLLLRRRRALGDGTFEVVVSFYLQHHGRDDTAEITCTMDQKEMEALIGELDRLCEKFPDRT